LASIMLILLVDSALYIFLSWCVCTAPRCWKKATPRRY
jgi:hypothetical protein